MILVIDNYDSFTYNLVQYIGQSGGDVVVHRNDEISVEQISELRPQGILLSPGPCTPNESGVCVDVIRHALIAEQGTAFDVPIFGVCLGHQTIGYVAGSTVLRAEVTKHGKSSLVEHDGKGLLDGMPNPFSAIRYHSLVVEKHEVPAGFEVTSRSVDDHEIMGVRHQSKPIEGVQYHPESVLTQDGLRIVQNFVRQVENYR